MKYFNEIPADQAVWFNGKLVDWKDATVHVMSHSLHYGCGMFEGIRCYKTPKGSFIFRLADHVDRLLDSCRMYRIDIPYSREALSEAIIDLVLANGYEECYIRPLVFRGTGAFGVNPFANSIEVAICTWVWGNYLGEEAREKGASVMVSSWDRTAPNTMPSMAKCAANYANVQLIKMEAQINGYSEGIALDTQGFVSEGGGANLFVVRKGTIFTPPLSASILAGITRGTVIKLARGMGYQLVEANIPREMLYIADELFFTGTAAEISPIAQVDKIKIGIGLRGPVTKALQDEFSAVIQGQKSDEYGWLTPVLAKKNDGKKLEG